jgi:hypothetical protein
MPSGAMGKGAVAVALEASAAGATATGAGGDAAQALWRATPAEKIQAVRSLGRVMTGA